MFFHHHSFVRAFAKHARRLSATAAGLAIAAVLVPLSGALMSHGVAAGDFEGQPGVEDADNGHFIRIALNKSVVIKLPANAKDVIVGNPEIVDAVVRTKNTAYLFARKVGQTNIFFFGPDGQQIMNIDLEVALDSKALHKLIQRTIPGSRITVDTVNENVILNGTASNAAEAKMAEDLAARFINASGATTNVVNAMSIAGEDQVMLKVRVVEVQRDVLKQLGVNLSAALDIGKLAASVVSSNPISTAYYTGRIAYNGDGFDISATLRALESDGVLHTLAEPTLSAVSGRSASFLAGGQFPYVSGRSCDDNGTNCINTITYKDFGVKLGFTPVVLTEGRISLTISTEVSELSDTASGALNTRSASTTIELPSGGSMMLAGLIKDTSQQTIDGTPGLKNLPVLGALFRSRNFTSNQTELVVIVTPYMVNPVNERQLATPIDNYNTATDRQTILFGRLNKVYGTPGKNPDGVYHGNVGFIVE